MRETHLLRTRNLTPWLPTVLSISSIAVRKCLELQLFDQDGPPRLVALNLPPCEIEFHSTDPFNLSLSSWMLH